MLGISGVAEGKGGGGEGVDVEDFDLVVLPENRLISKNIGTLEIRTDGDRKIKNQLGGGS